MYKYSLLLFSLVTTLIIGGGILFFEWHLFNDISNAISEATNIEILK